MIDIHSSMKMPSLNFAENYNFIIKKKENQFFVFDIVRKKEVHLSSEEWVRQHFLQNWVQQKKIAKSQIIVEKKIILNKQTKRIDILLLKKNEPFLMVECKAPEQKIDNKVFEQAARYNSVIKAKFILLSNGFSHLYFEYNKEENTYQFLENEPKLI